MSEPPGRPLNLDVRHSPAQAIRPELLGRGKSMSGAAFRGGSASAQACDETLRWLMASDRLIGEQTSRALCEVKEARLYLKEGCARWSTYLRACVPMTPRWCQQEIWRARELRNYAALEAAYSRGEISKSHLRVILRVVTPETEDLWRERGQSMTVRQLEAAAREVRARMALEVKPAAEEVGQRPRRRAVMAPPAVAVMVAEAVEVARKLEGYQIGRGQAVAMMAMETMAGLPEWPDPMPGGEAVVPEQVMESDAVAPEPAEKDAPGGGPSFLGDQEELRQELGRDWEEVHKHMEEISGRWLDLPWDLPEVVLKGAPPDDAEPHERVVFWTAVAGRLDAVRGRLLRLVQERSYADRLRFAGLGQYARERMGLSLREAKELIRLDRELSDLPVAFRMYASGRLGKRAAWLVAKVADPKTDRAWTRFAMTHTLRLLEAAVEAALLRREVEPERWRESGGLPPVDASFAEITRMCSHFSQDVRGVEPSARIEFVLDTEQQACYEQALGMLRGLYGRDRPEWWGLAVMARHFLNMYADADRESVPERLRRMVSRRVIERDNYTCAAPECLQRGGLEADHVWFRSQGGPTTLENMTSECGMDHRLMKHQIRSLMIYGTAPDNLTVRMGRCVYRKDKLISPAFQEKDLDSDPWAVKEVSALYRAVHSSPSFFQS